MIIPIACFIILFLIAQPADAMRVNEHAEPQTPDEAVIDAAPGPDDRGAIREPLDAQRFQWRSATNDSFKLLMLQNGARISLQAKTRNELGGPLLGDWVDTLTTRPAGFMDNDSMTTNFVGHPIQGAAAFHIARVRGATRSQAFWWGVAYSTHFELGLLGEAGIGNVTASPVDLVVTPTAGFALGMVEEWLWDRLATNQSRVGRIARFLLPGRQLTRLVSGR